jgi:RNAse (barnase) inhibitor barstar
MAVFQGDDFNRLDWRLLQNGAIQLYHRLSILQEDIAWLLDHRYLLQEFDCSVWKSHDDFHDAMSSTLNFPDYYGRNIAAFNDCLSDLEIPDEGGVVLVFLHFDHFVAKDAEFAGWVLDYIQDNAWRFSLWGRRLLSLLQSDDAHIQLRPIGACAPSWNPREWLDSTREL